MKISIGKDFFNHYITNSIESFENLDDSAVIDYSTVGQHSGKDEIVKALKTDGEYTYRYNVVSNIVEYDTEKHGVLIANVFHYFVKVVKNQYSPLIVGGKYKLLFHNDRISEIRFDLEAESGNTYLAKTDWKWKLYEETKDRRSVMMDDVNPVIDNDRDAILNSLFCFLLIADTEQGELLDKYVSQGAVCELATTTYREQFSTADSMKNSVPIREYIGLIKKKEDQSHHSCHVRSVKINGNTADVVIEMFEPTRLGYKHFDALSVYKPYYNEQWEIKFVKDRQWKIKEFSCRPISRFETIGYTTLEI